MSEQKLRQIAVETALSCPCCGALVQLTTVPDLHPEDTDLALEILKLLRRRHLGLVTIEDAEERAKRRGRRSRDT